MQPQLGQRPSFLELPSPNLVPTGPNHFQPREISYECVNSGRADVGGDIRDPNNSILHETPQEVTNWPLSPFDIKLRALADTR
jgi:hypothetical protein